MSELLQEMTTAEDAEREHMVKLEQLGPDPIPFGFQHARWVLFKKKIKQGDQLWKFGSTSDSWKHLTGNEGFCILRRGVLIASFTTRIS